MRNVRSTQKMLGGGMLGNYSVNNLNCGLYGYFSITLVSVSFKTQRHENFNEMCFAVPHVFSKREYSQISFTYL